MDAWVLRWLPGLMPGCFGLLGLAVWIGFLKGRDNSYIQSLTHPTLLNGRWIYHYYCDYYHVFVTMANALANLCIAMNFIISICIVMIIVIVFFSIVVIAIVIWYAYAYTYIYMYIYIYIYRWCAVSGPRLIGDQNDVHYL